MVNEYFLASHWLHSIPYMKIELGPLSFSIQLFTLVPYKLYALRPQGRRIGQGDDAKDTRIGRLTECQEQSENFPRTYTLVQKRMTRLPCLSQSPRVHSWDERKVYNRILQSQVKKLQAEYIWLKKRTEYILSSLLGSIGTRVTDRRFFQNIYFLSHSL